MVKVNIFLIFIFYFFDVYISYFLYFTFCAPPFIYSFYYLSTRKPYFLFFIFHFLALLGFIYLFHLFPTRNLYILILFIFYILPCAIWQFNYLFYFPAPWAILAFWPGPGWARARPWWADWARAWGLRPGPGPASNKLKGFRGSQAPMPGNIFKSQAK